MSVNEPDRLLGEERTAIAVAAALRRDFAAEFQRIMGRNPSTEPMLQVLWEAVSLQVGRMYDDAASVFPERVVDDLVASLGLPEFSAVPAQTVVAFQEVEFRESLTADNAIVGYSRTGEEVPFRPDVAIDLVPAGLRFAGVLERGTLTTLDGAQLDDIDTPLPRLAVPCPAATGAPLLLLGVTSRDGHLSGLGIHVDSDERGGVGLALARSPWHLLSPAGAIHEPYTLLPSRIEGGVVALDWVGSAGASATRRAPGPSLNVRVAEGPWGHQCFVLPAIPVERRAVSPPPKLIRDQIEQHIPADQQQALLSPMTWIAVPLPGGLRQVADGIRRVTVNAVTASNLDVLSEHVRFTLGAAGSVVSVRPEGSKSRFLLAAQSIHGEDASRYFPEGDILAPPLAGRFRIDRDRVFLWAGRREDGRTDRYAQMRLIFTDGDRGNDVEAGRVTRVDGLANPTVVVTSVTPSKGGVNPPKYPQRRERLAEVLRSRERAVTVEDFQVLTRAVEPRVRSVSVEYVASLRDQRLQPLQQVKVVVSRQDFPPGDPASELVRLRGTLERHLQERALLGQVVRVIVEQLP